MPSITAPDFQSSSTRNLLIPLWLYVIHFARWKSRSRKRSVLAKRCLGNVCLAYYAIWQSVNLINWIAVRRLLEVAVWIYLNLFLLSPSPSPPLPLSLTERHSLRTLYCTCITQLLITSPTNRVGYDELLTTQFQFWISEAGNPLDFQWIWSCVNNLPLNVILVWIAALKRFGLRAFRSITVRLMEFYWSGRSVQEIQVEERERERKREGEDRSRWSTMNCLLSLMAFNQKNFSGELHISRCAPEQLVLSDSGMQELREF